MESERQSRGIAGVSRAFLIIIALIGFDPDNATRAADVSKSDTATEDRVQALIPAIEAYIASGMRGFDVPGLALGIVAGDKLIYAKGFGVRSKSGGMPVIHARSSRSVRTPKHFSLRPRRSWSIAASYGGTTASSISIRNFS
jgi:CubicO group peptidase (beta-lactamase class C family)